MNADIVLQLVEVAISLARSRADGTAEQDAKIATTLMTIVRKGAQAYKEHTGEALDPLLIAETTIDQAKAAYRAGDLPPESRDALNALVRSYNVARDAWLTYRGALATNTPADPYFQELNKNLADLMTAIREVKEVKK